MGVRTMKCCGTCGNWRVLDEYCYRIRRKTRAGYNCVSMYMPFEGSGK